VRAKPGNAPHLDLADFSGGREAVDGNPHRHCRRRRRLRVVAAFAAVVAIHELPTLPWHVEDRGQQRLAVGKVRALRRDRAAAALWRAKAACWPSVLIKGRALCSRNLHNGHLVIHAC